MKYLYKCPHCESEMFAFREVEEMNDPAYCFKCKKQTEKQVTVPASITFKGPDFAANN